MLVRWGACVALIATPLVAGAGPAPAGPSQAAPHAALTASLALEVRDAEAAADRIVREAEAAGGYFVVREAGRVVLKVPAERLDGVLELVEGLGRASARRVQATPLGTEADRTTAKLAAEEQMLERYLALLAGADRDGALRVEQEIASLVASIETLRGARRLDEHRAAFAELEVSLRAIAPVAPVRDGRSSFAWIERLDMVALREDFRRAR